MSTKKIMLLGLYGQHNLGNDCSLQAMISNIRKYAPNGEIGCICTGPDSISTWFKIPSYQISPFNFAPHASGGRLTRILSKVFLRVPTEIWNWITAYKVLKGVDALVIPGTGLLVDFMTPFGYPYYVFKWTIIGKLRRCKILIVSVGAGPIYHTLSRRFTKFALSLADYRSYRDYSSRNYLQNIGFKANSDPVYPDLVFSLPKDIIPTGNPRSRHRPVIGVGLMDYTGQCGSLKHDGDGQGVYRNYLNKNGIFIKWLLTKNYRVRLLIGDLTYDTPVKNDLLKVLSQNGITVEDGQLIDEPIHTVEQLVLQLAQTDIVVSARFHNIVLSGMLGKPSIALSYNDKFESLMEYFGMSEYCLRLEDFEVNRLIKQFLKLEKNAESIISTIKSKTQHCRAVLDEQYAVIFNDIILK